MNYIIHLAADRSSLYQAISCRHS